MRYPKHPQHFLQPCFKSCCRAVISTCLVLLLSGCFRVELNGPVGGATVTLAPYHAPLEIEQTVVSRDEAALISTFGAETWAEMTPELKRLFLGSLLFDNRLIDDSQYYTITATGGFDYDHDRDGVLDAQPTPVQGTWHAIVRGDDIKASRGRVSLLTEAVQRFIVSRFPDEYFGIDSPTGEATGENPILAGSSGAPPASNISPAVTTPRDPPPPPTPGVLPDANARQLVRDITGDGEVDYADLLRWSALTSMDSYLGSRAALEDMAQAITEGQELRFDRLVWEVMRAEYITVYRSLFPDLDNCSVVGNGAAFVHEPTWIRCGLPSSRNPNPSLEGIEAFTNLETVQFNNFNVSNYLPLAGLPRLRELFGVRGGGEGTLAQVTNVSTLHEVGFADEDPSWLADLDSVKDIRISFPPADLMALMEALGGMENLERLRLARSDLRAEELAMLSGLQSLERLSFDVSTLADISSFPPLASLEILNLVNTGISDVTPLGALPALKALNLNGNSITDISALAGLGNIEELRLAFNSITDLPDFSALRRIRVLELHSNALTSIDGLENLTTLASLDLRDNPDVPCGDIQGLVALLPQTQIRYNCQ